MVNEVVRNPDLEAQLSVDDDQPSLVYADWLQQHGNPHGELIHVQHALLAEPRSVPLRRREAELLDTHATELVGPALAPSIHLLEWRGGFVRGAALDRVPLHELRARSSGRLLTQLTCVAGAQQAVVDHLVLDPPPLRALALHGDEPTDLDRLWRALPDLERLELAGCDFELGTPVHDKLRELVIRPLVLEVDTTTALAHSELPALIRLELSLEETDRNEGYFWRAGLSAASAVGPEHLEAMLRALRSVTELAIHDTDLGDRLCEVVASASCACQLRTLDLRFGTITDRGAAILADKGRFAALERLALEENQIRSDVLTGVYRALELGPQY